MRKALLVTSIALILAPAAIVAGYFGLQAYLDWLLAGAKRPMAGNRRSAGTGEERAAFRVEPRGSDA